MGRIKGHYEWDDDDLTPGKKREGGLHQNLFDSEGQLKGNARFVPADDFDDEPFVVTETVYVPVEERRRTPEQEALDAAIAALVESLLDRGIARIRPHVDRFVQEKALPFYDAKAQALRENLARRKARKAALGLERSTVRKGQDPGEVSVEDRPGMSKAEAQARYLAALAAQAYSEEQMRLVGNADIVDCDGVPELQRSLSVLPVDQVANLLKTMATKPQMLEEPALAELASVLGRHAHSGAIEMGPASRR